MSRLTDKNITFAEKETLEMFQQEREHWQEFCIRMGRIENKLKELEDLEEELGCPLYVVFKALKNGIYRSLENGKIILEKSFKLNLYQGNGWHLIKPKLSFPLADYKKTWWLREDKSERYEKINF